MILQPGREALLLVVIVLHPWAFVADRFGRWFDAGYLQDGFWFDVVFSHDGQQDFDRPRDFKIAMRPAARCPFVLGEKAPGGVPGVVDVDAGGRACPEMKFM